jgi:hypothetical protein
MNSDKLEDIKAKALRQYRHNDNSGFVFGYDMEVIDAFTASMQEEIDRLTKSESHLEGLNYRLNEQIQQLQAEVEALPRWVKFEDEEPPLKTITPVKVQWANGVHLHIGRYIRAKRYKMLGQGSGEKINAWIDNDAGDGMHVLEWLKQPEPPKTQE